MEWLWLKTLVSLLLILGLIVGTLWILKRFMTFSKPASGSGIGMEVAGVLHLAPRRAVYAVKTGGHVLLLGVAEHGITFLTQLPESACAAAGAGSSTAGMAHNPLNSMSPFLRILTERFTHGAAAPEPVMQSEISLETPVSAVKKAGASAAPRKKAPKHL